VYPTSRDAATPFLTALLDTIDDAIVTISSDGLITSWNGAAESLYGFASADAIGQPIDIVVPQDKAAEEADLRRQALDGATVQNHETIGRRRNGSACEIAVTVAPIRGDGGAILGLVRVARDISARHRSERAGRRLAAIVESSGDAIASKDLNGIVTSWNRAAERMFGYSAAEMVGESIRRIIPEDRLSEEDDVLAHIRRGERVDHFETIRKRKDGALIQISLTVSPILDAKGTVIGASKIARDISDRKRIEAERDRLLKISQENARLKDEFLATLSHELRTPLNAILGYARMIKSGIITPEKLARAVGTIERNASSLTQIVEDILDVSRIISGKMRLDVQSVEVPDVVRSAVESVMPAAEAKGIRLETVLDPRAAPVSGDPARLQQVIWNLLSNAVKFTGRGGRVQVRLQRVDSHVEIDVSDTGIGIAPEFLPFVFDRFRQADSGTARERGGLGLGLGIARQLVEMHGGTVEAASPGKDRGSTFRIRLPVMIVHTERAATALSSVREQRDAATLAAANLQDVHVLAVDDDRDALVMVRDILESAGARVSIANSAVDALTALGDDRPDVLVADLGLPRMDGFELIAEVRRHADEAVRTVPAAALTAYARSEDRSRALRSGFHLHLAKPIDPTELIAAVASLATRRR
jgi:PAS domain S-box-containing protein